ncbi:MAG: PAS domain S-box protein [Chloroflexi bacterium]|nr:PAS domain S-box protein [Chloroflexota bacterium]
MLPEIIFPAVVETLPDAVVIVSREGVIEFLNAQTEAMFGYERGELVGQPVNILVPDEFRTTHEHHRRDFARRPGTRPMGVGLELWGRRKDGSLFPVEISLSSLVRGAQMYVTSVIRDLSERNQMRNELETERERQRIAMDLHDGTIQSIYAVGLGLELALTNLISDPVEAGKRIDSSIEQLGAVAGDIRAYIFDLRSVRYSGNLAHDLALTVEEFRAITMMNVESELHATAPSLRDDRAAAVLHIVREALANVRKHSGASTVTLGVSENRDAVTIEIRDDGVGFAAPVELSETHRGLRNMRLRTQRLGGVFDVESAPGQGATIRVRMPVTL